MFSLFHTAAAMLPLDRCSLRIVCEPPGGMPGEPTANARRAWAVRRTLDGPRLPLKFSMVLVHNRRRPRVRWRNGAHPLLLAHQPARRAHHRIEGAPNLSMMPCHAHLSPVSRRWQRNARMGRAREERCALLSCSPRPSVTALTTSRRSSKESFNCAEVACGLRGSRDAVHWPVATPNSDGNTRRASSYDACVYVPEQDDRAAAEQKRVYPAR